MLCIQSLTSETFLSESHLRPKFVYLFPECSSLYLSTLRKTNIYITSHTTLNQHLYHGNEVEMNLLNREVGWWGRQKNIALRKCSSFMRTPVINDPIFRK